MKFTEEQVEELVIDWEVERIEGENRRWSRTNISIVEFEDKHYRVYWEQGLTERQENEYEEQDAPEVEPVEYEKTITVKEWVKVGGD